jgi:hypothetical protein
MERSWVLYRFNKLLKRFEQRRKLGSPLIPVMAPWDRAKIMGDIVTIEQCSKFAVRSQQTFLLTAGEIEERGFRGIGASCDETNSNKRLADFENILIVMLVASCAPQVPAEFL